MASWPLSWSGATPLGQVPVEVGDESKRSVSLTVKEGETVGILGRNGSGKSTLLKCVCGVLQPTSGEVMVRGKLAGLLELGAGFQPDLTGRENIYLNGTILGMTRQEIDKKFDAIVAFSELEDFLDTPVKRFSSGMYARLGFAVAFFSRFSKPLGRLRLVFLDAKTVLVQKTHCVVGPGTSCGRGLCRPLRGFVVISRTCFVAKKIKPGKVNLSLCLVVDRAVCASVACTRPLRLSAPVTVGTIAL